MKLYVVDDDPMARMIAVDALSAHAHEVQEFESGTALLGALHDTPDLILLDIEMPGMDGISVCKQLRSDGHDSVQVIFVSAHDDLDNRLAAYNAGGSDFIIKPYYAEELQQKVRVAEQIRTHRDSISQQAAFAQSTAFTAMSSMGEMGVILDFLRGSFACAEPRQLCDKISDALHQFGLNGLIQLRVADGKHCYSSRGDCTPLESSILEHSAGMGRQFQFRDRLAINYTILTLLVMGLPLDDPDRLGRLRDHLAILAEGAEARLEAMESEQKRRDQSAHLIDGANELSAALEMIQKKQAEIRARTEEIEMQYQSGLSQTLMRLGLTDGQEAALSALTQQYESQLNALHDDDGSISDRLRAITQRLRKVAR